MKKLLNPPVCLLFLVTAYVASAPVVHSNGVARTPRQQVGSEAVTIQLQSVLVGLSSPVYVTNAHDNSDRLFIVEQAGIIKVLQHGATSPTVFLNITTRVLSGGERGMLGLAFHPQFSTNRRFFVCYTRQTDGAIVVAEYRVSSADPNVADTAETVILNIPHPGQSNHNGGMIEFGPDAFLYIGTGDGGSANDPPNNAQNINALLGKILRIDIDHPNGSLTYSSPSSNPFFGSTAGADEIYAYGQRNPWRYSFDRGTGQLYLGDVGQGAREEIDIVTPGGNYGWRIMEGSICNPSFNGGVCTPPTGQVLPISEYSHSGGRCSITGGYVYRGSLSSLPAGSYVFADFCTGEIFMMQSGLNTSPVLLDTTLSISSFGEDESGEIYVVNLGGSLHRITNPNPPPVQNRANHELADCARISGWAWDATQPNTPINVEIHDGNTFIATVAANQFRQDLLDAGIGNGSHAFTFPTPARLKDGQPHSVSVRFASTNLDLPGSPKSITCGGGPVFQANHEVADCGRISGWAWDANQPNTPISVDVFDGNTLIATVAANIFRMDLLNAGLGNGSHGFSLATPASLKDGQVHSVSVKFASTNLDLAGTPRAITCTGAPVLQGNHEVADCTRISGWAWDANQPNSAINVDIVDGTTLITTIAADQFRQDLLDAGVGNGNHAFSFTVPASLKDGQTHTMLVRFSGTMTPVPNSPRNIGCP